MSTKILRIKRTPYLTTLMMNEKKSFIGIEYVVELEDVTKQKPSYKCTLCDKFCDSNNILSHTTSFHHREKFLELHFQILMRSLRSISRYNEDMNFKAKALNKICRTIEHHFGRMRPFVFNIQRFDYFETEIMKDIKNFPHFNEKLFLKREEKLILKIKKEKFTEEDKEVVKIVSKRKKPTKFERNDKRREEMKKLEEIRKLKDFLNKRNCSKSQIDYESSGKTSKSFNTLKMISTPVRADSDAETLIYSKERLERSL